MVTIHPAPHSPHGASPEMIKAGHRLAQELDTPFHIHVAEEMFEVEETLEKYKLRPVHYLNDLGVVDERMIAIHLVWLEDSEIRLLGEKMRLWPIVLQATCFYQTAYRGYRTSRKPVFGSR